MISTKVQVMIFVSLITWWKITFLLALACQDTSNPCTFIDTQYASQEFPGIANKVHTFYSIYYCILFYSMHSLLDSKSDVNTPWLYFCLLLRKTTSICVLTVVTIHNMILLTLFIASIFASYFTYCYKCYIYFYCIIATYFFIHICYFFYIC